jgi:hypothetical protein
MKINLRHTLRILLLLPVALSGTGCGGWLFTQTAVQTFMKQQSCPKDRVQYKYVTLKPEEVFERPAPPAEVAADPARLTVWRQETDEEWAGYGDFSAYEAMGCGADVYYFCWSETQNGEAVFFCDNVDLETPQAKFGRYHLKASAGQDLKQRLQAGKK